MVSRLSSPEELTAASTLVAKPCGTFHPGAHADPIMSLSTSAPTLVPSPRLPLPKPPQGSRKVLRKIEGLDDPLIRMLPHGRVGIRGEIENLEHRLGEVLTGRAIDQKARHTRLNLINE